MWLRPLVCCAGLFVWAGIYLGNWATSSPHGSDPWTNVLRVSCSVDAACGDDTASSSVERCHRSRANVCAWEKCRVEREDIHALTSKSRWWKCATVTDFDRANWKCYEFLFVHKIIKTTCGSAKWNGCWTEGATPEAEMYCQSSRLKDILMGIHSFFRKNGQKNARIRWPWILYSMETKIQLNVFFTKDFISAVSKFIQPTGLSRPPGRKEHAHTEHGTETNLADWTIPFINRQ